jgi:hypothetical protein
MQPSLLLPLFVFVKIRQPEFDEEQDEDEEEGWFQTGDLPYPKSVG